MVCLFSPSFWLSFQPCVFTQKYRLKALVKYWREQGIHIFTHLDDGAGAEKSLETARAAQVRELLDFILNLREGTIQVPLQRNIINRLRDKIDLIVHCKSLVTACQLAGMVGSVVSMGFKHLARSAVCGQGL